MGYFSNGDHFDWYWEKYCSKCINWREDETGEEGCPVIDLHWIYQGGEKMQEVLDLFIPRDGWKNLKCRMFYLSKEYTSEVLKENDLEDILKLFDPLAEITRKHNL